MNEIFDFLKTHEPTISLMVTGLTVFAGAWGFLLVAVKPILRRSPRAASDVSSGPSLWSSLVGKGVSTKADYREQISGRTLNACLIVVVSIAGFLALLGLLEANIAISSINLFLLLSAIASYNLHGAGFARLARWTLILGTMLFWNFNLLLMGPGLGLEYCMGAVMLVPILLFDVEKSRYSLFGACALIIVSLPLSLLAQGWLANFSTLNSIETPPFYYHGNAVFVASLVFWILFFYNQSADASFAHLEDQRAKSEELIHGMLPAYIAEKVKERGSTVADWHSEATVLYASVTGFDELYRRISAVQLLEILRDVFDDFDRLIDAYDLEKINTLGSSYVAATGIEPSKENSSTKLAQVALKMRDVVERLAVAVDHPFGVRIGISTGDLVSGVIGKGQPNFDIWGKTVELAGSIKHRAPLNSIVVSDSAYWRLKQDFEFSRYDDVRGGHILTGPRVAG